MFSKDFGLLKVAKSLECQNDERALVVVGQYSVSGGPLKGPTSTLLKICLVLWCYHVLIGIVMYVLKYGEQDGNSVYNKLVFSIISIE